jgi:hypothetical protein
MIGDPFLNYFALGGEVAIYTDHFHHVSMLRRVLLRMKSWQNYIYMEGH